MSHTTTDPATHCGSDLSAARDRVVAATAGKSTPEVETMLKDGTLNCGDVLSILIEDGVVTLPAPGGPALTGEEVAAELGLT